MRYYHFFSTLLVAFSVTCLVGCGPSGPAIQHVEGIVTLDGEPVEGANVSFAPEDGTDDLNGPLLASGTTDASGKYTLSTTRGTRIGGGTTVGRYNVTIVKKEIANPLTGPLAPGQSYVPRHVYHVPAIFEGGREGPSPIKAEVVRGRNRFDFDLKSDGTFTVNGQ